MLSEHRHDTLSKLAQHFLDSGGRVWDLIVQKCPTCGYALLTAEATEPPPACSYCASSKADPNPCSVFYPHLPHDYCDGKPDAHRIGERLPSPHLPPGVRLDPASMEERIAELERRQVTDARWIAALQERIAKLERLTGNGE